ncbi:MAG: flagellar basal body rod protein FlgC [Pseudomonadota bacterium]|uniref:flagellar basal body rod protein FlgC n=1 Tax=Herminiimonas arsenitoxidans TaxID=1809410 RepID=UPI0009713391|nr:flagellar basal body rod protein FlgC [Herminiimonas arsenitoxidans]
MSLFNIFNVAGSAMSAQSQRLNVVSSNIANAESTTSANGKTYRAKQVEFQSLPMKGGATSTGVKVNRVVEDASPLKMVFDPKHPNADETGHVAMPNVNVVEEMVNMISASRSYQTNVETMNTAKTMLLKTLTLGQ